VSLLLWQRAESRRLQAEALVRSAHTILKVGNRMAEDSLLQTPGSLEYRYNRLRQSIDFLSGLLTEFPNDSELQYELAVANFLLGKVCARRGWYSLIFSTRCWENIKSKGARIRPEKKMSSWSRPMS
jgi:hypothetical protein